MGFAIIPDLPAVQRTAIQQSLITSHAQLCAAIHDFSEKLEELEEHMAVCPDCAADAARIELRCLLIQRKAECLEGLAEVEFELGWGEN